MPNTPTPDHDAKIAAFMDTYLPFQAVAHRELLQLIAEARKNPDCALCGTEIAVFPCTHILKTDTQVTMSLKAWEDMAEAVRKLQDLEAYLEDNVQGFDSLEDLLRATAQEELLEKFEELDGQDAPPAGKEQQ
jgi:hypothetical protein